MNDYTINYSGVTLVGSYKHLCELLGADVVKKYINLYDYYWSNSTAKFHKLEEMDETFLVNEIIERYNDTFDNYFDTLHNSRLNFSKFKEKCLDGPKKCEALNKLLIEIRKR